MLHYAFFCAPVYSCGDRVINDGAKGWYRPVRSGGWLDVKCSCTLVIELTRRTRVNSCEVIACSRRRSSGIL